MKKVKAITRAASQTNNIAALKFKTVDEYIAALPAQTKNICQELRKTIRKAAPNSEETISYNMPAFKLNGTGFIWFAAWKKHISLYPRSAAMEASIKELSAYKGAKGTIKFPLDNPFPFDLITKIVKFKLKENQDQVKQKN